MTMHEHGARMSMQRWPPPIIALHSVILARL